MTDRIEENEMKNDPILQAILTALRESGNTTKMLNPSRYYDVLLAKDALDSLLLKIGLEDKSTIKMHYAFSTASVCTEIEYLEVHDMRELFFAAGKANTLEIMPLTNGKISIAFTFQNVLVPIEYLTDKEDS